MVKFLESERLDTRIGACHALEKLRGRAAPAVPQLRVALQHEDLWLRVRAATALAAIGKPALLALPDMLELIARGPSKHDPRGMEQRFVSFAIFGKMLTRGNTKSREGVDRDKLRSAISLGLQNQDGRARSEISEIFGRLSYAS